MNCYCGNPKPYSSCCQPIHKNRDKALTAEELMRSRYSAFVLADGEYLMQSHHYKTRNLKEKKAIVAWAKSVQWIKLEILDTSKGTKNDTEGTVTFNAYFYENGNVNVIHENSAFVKENNQWHYWGKNN
ncbi:YchJ family metal-binding protein [uncultured Algibacter sp.]|uniref:YchJ family protein n=1 Tax=uncultured Algibacter sp. TaxID=298659 RepID=UPI003217ACC5